MRSLVMLVVLLVASAHGRTPEETVRAYVDKMKAEGMGTVTQLIHPEELTKFHGMMAPVIEEAFKDREGRRVFARFADPADGTKPRQLQPVEFMTVFLQWLEGVQPQIVEVLKGSNVDVIGHVREGDVSHVVTRFRTKVQGIEMEKISVVSTRDHQGEQRVMLSGEIKQIAETLRARRR